MYNIEALKKLMCDKEGNVKAFCVKNGIKYTTLRSNMESSDKFANTSLSNIFKISDGLEITVDELVEAIKEQR